MDADHSLKVYESILDLIASPSNPSPMVRLSKSSPNSNFELFAKLEWFNPFGSIKDRPALNMFLQAEQEGKLNGKSIVEPSSGNTGLALAGIAAKKGVDLVVTVPSEVPEEKKILIRLLGAKVEDVPDSLCPANPKDGAIALANAYATSPKFEGKYFMPNQYENKNNLIAHYQTTGPEIWKQTKGKITHFFAGIGTTGTLSGAGKYLKEQNPKVKIIAVEPQKGHHLPGLKNLSEAATPGIYDKSVVDETIEVSDKEGYDTLRRVMKEEALLAGPTTGAILHAALQTAREEQEGLGVLISPDSALKYANYIDKMLSEK